MGRHFELPKIPSTTRSPFLIYQLIAVFFVLEFSTTLNHQLIRHSDLCTSATGTKDGEFLRPLGEGRTQIRGGLWVALSATLTPGVCLMLCWYRRRGCARCCHFQCRLCGHCSRNQRALVHLHKLVAHQGREKLAYQLFVYIRNVRGAIASLVIV